MLSILIQLNPSYLLGVMEKDPLVSRRYDRGREQGMGASSRTVWHGPENQHISRRKEGAVGHEGCVGGVSPGAGIGVRLEAV